MRKFFSSTLILIAAITGTASAATPTTLLKLPATCSGTTLGELVACRLSISTLVGRDKYATGSAIEDKTREAVVITNGIKAGAPLGISEAAATSWWGAQIEASKQIQRGVITGAENAGLPRINKGPKVADLRGALDTLTLKMNALYGKSCSDQVITDAVKADPNVNIPALLTAAGGLPRCVIASR